MYLIVQLNFTMLLQHGKYSRNRDILVMQTDLLNYVLYIQASIDTLQNHKMRGYQQETSRTAKWDHQLVS